MSIRRWS